MPPNQMMNGMSANYVQYVDDHPKENGDMKKISIWPRTQQPIIWLNTISIILFHIIAVISFFLTIYKMKILTLLWILLYGGFAGFGVTAGVHRLWSHRSYKARLPLKILLLICYSAAGMVGTFRTDLCDLCSQIMQNELLTTQNSLYDWVRDHRVHHKYSETDADPHNSKRGFFFAHVGWLMQRKHPEVIRKGNNLDFRDILEDPLLQFYNRYFLIFKIFFCFVLPVYVPIHFWNETLLNAFCSQALIRYMGVLNMTWSVNSFAHIWGQRPYDNRIRPVENIGVAIVALGEGWHNYHHVFPWDYKAAELGNYKFNITTMFLDLFVKLGLAYDVKQPSAELVRTVIEKYGDGSHVPEVPPDAREEKYE